jgi:phage-related protein (TIGR01555 family)
LRLKNKVKEASKWMLAFGRGIIVVHHKGDDLSKPLAAVDSDKALLNVFSGDMVTIGDIDRDLQSARYYKPKFYNVRGEIIHHTRVVDFTYVQPPELDAPAFFYGGIGEFDLIYDQLIADGVVQRAAPKIIEKASSMFYKVAGFKDAMRNGTDVEMVDYFGRMEDIRGIYTAGLIDKEDDLEVVSQNISNLSDADMITLRRLAMVTSIPLSMLVGENVKGLNSSGDSERAAFQDAIEIIQDDYLEPKINELMRKLGKGDISFRDNQGETANDRIDYETKVIDNAIKLASIGEDYAQYLEDKDIVKADDFSTMFKNEEV